MCDTSGSPYCVQGLFPFVYLFGVTVVTLFVNYLFSYEYGFIRLFLTIIEMNNSGKLLKRVIYTFSTIQYI